MLTNTEAEKESGLLQELLLILPDINDREGMRQLLQRYHPADIAEAMNEMPHEIQARLLQLMEPEEQGDFLDEISDDDVVEHTKAMPVAQLSEIVSVMPPDEAAYLLDGIDDSKAEDVLENLNRNDAEQIRELLSYPPDTAGRIMNNEFFHVPPQTTVQEVLSKLKAANPDSDTFGTVIICREDMKFLGTVAPEDLLTAGKDALVSSLMERATVSVGPHADQEVCARYMHKYDLDILPVLDPHRRIIGLITVDDILDVMEQEASEDLYRMAGVGSERPLEEPTLARTAKRLPWFIVNLINMSFLGYIMRHFQTTIEQVVAVSFFIPAVMGLSGSIGIQAATITVRGLSSGEITFRDVFWVLRRELMVGMLIGIFCGVMLGGVSCYLEPAPPVAAAETLPEPNAGLKTPVAAAGGSGKAPASATAPDSAARAEISAAPETPQTNDAAICGIIPRFPFVVALAMFVGSLGAVTLGTCVPMFCHRIGIDPAIASGPFVTTIVDIGTQTLYLALATWILLM